MATNDTKTLPHPDYGLPTETRLTILTDAQRVGVKRAAEEHRVHPSIIYIWRHRYGLVANTKPKK